MINSTKPGSGPQSTKPKIAVRRSGNLYRALLAFGAFIPLLSLTPVRAASFASDSFLKVWQRTDLPVVQGTAARSFMWGPAPFKVGYENYQEGNQGTRLIEYFDKARMEITRPDSDSASPYYVTNGLLVRELISGGLQVGDNSFNQRQPAQVPIAGDPAEGNPDAPTYASFKDLASLNNDRRAGSAVGQKVTAYLTKAGSVSYREDLGRYAVNAYYSPELGHNIPDVFWNFMRAAGPVYLGGGNYANAAVVDWLSAMGLPITEAYWSKVKVGGVDKEVLTQAFERRVLTYTPSNDPAFRVEMGNVGLHYARWRFNYLNLLNLTSPADEAVVSQSTLTVSGHLNRAEAVVSVGDQLAEPDSNDNFSVTVNLQPGLNTIEVIASTSRDQEVIRLRVIYQP